MNDKFFHYCLVILTGIIIFNDIGGFVLFVESFSSSGGNDGSTRKTVVTYGPNARELILLTSKLAAKDGYESFCICAPGQEGKSRQLMYGSDDENENENDSATMDTNTNTDTDTSIGDEQPQQRRAIPVSSPEDIQNALTKANVLILVSYDQPIEEKALNTLLNTAGNDYLSKIVLISKMGVSGGGGGGFFGGGKSSKLLDSENKIRSICKSKNIDISIVRAGQLKGGGPGEPAENDCGLNKKYYNTILELSEASVTMSHDRFTLGVDCSKGDSVDVPNMFTLLGTKASFEAAPYDTNRINAAAAAVTAANHNKPVEFSVGTQKSTTLPSKEEWERIIKDM